MIWTYTWNCYTVLSYTNKNSIDLLFNVVLTLTEVFIFIITIIISRIIFNRLYMCAIFLYLSGLEKAMLTNSPSEKQLARFANQLSYNSCRELVIQLGLQRKDWEDIERSYTGLSLIIKIMALHSWKTKRIKGKLSKSFNDLLDAMKAIGDNRHLLCEVWTVFFFVQYLIWLICVLNHLQHYCFFRSDQYLFVEEAAVPEGNHRPVVEQLTSYLVTIWVECICTSGIRTINRSFDQPVITVITLHRSLGH